MGERYHIGDLSMEVDSFSVRRDGEEIPLPALSFDLLLTLARRAPGVVTSEELIRSVWDGAAVSDETLTQRVALLRRVLGDDARRPRYVRSVRGRGYALVPEVRSTSQGPPESSGARVRAWLAAAAVVVTMASVGIVFWPGSEREPVPAGELSTRPPSVEELVQRAGEYLARHREEDNELAIELYERALEISPDNVAALAGLSFGLSQRVTKFNRAGEQRRRALELADRALELDPSSGLAHHARALALDSLGRQNGALTAYTRAVELDPGRVWALSSAAYVLFVQGRLAEALHWNVRVGETPERTPYWEVQMGSTLAALGFERAATLWLERALELRPDNVFAAVAFARVRLSQGRLAEAEALAIGALERGIRRPELHEILGHVALLRGERAEAAARYRAALDVNPRAGDAYTRLFLLEQGTDGGGETGYDERVQELREARRTGDESWANAYLESLLHVGFQQPAAALEALDLAIDRGYRDAGWLRVDPVLASLRNSRGAKERIERIQALIAAERAKLENARWLPPQLIPQ